MPVERGDDDVGAVGLVQQRRQQARGAMEGGDVGVAGALDLDIDRGLGEGFEVLAQRRDLDVAGLEAGDLRVTVPRAPRRVYAASGSPWTVLRPGTNQ